MSKDPSIKLSPKHGVNPSMLVCFLCGGDCGIALVGRLKDDEQAPRYMYDRNPCNKCKEGMKQGFMMVEVKDNTDRQNPHRTGRSWVIKTEAAVKAGFDTSKGACFIEESAFKKMLGE